MPTVTINDCKYFYEEVGKGKETILFSHGLLFNYKMFENQIEYFKNNYRIVAFDHRGQGKSEVTKDGYSMDQLYKDALKLIEVLNLGKVHFVGLSMGGFLGFRLAARNPEVIKSLILLETSAGDEPNKVKYWFLNTIVKLFGVKPVIGKVKKILFGEKFLKDPLKLEVRRRWVDHLKSLPKTIVRAVDGVIHRDGVEDELGKISCPTLVMVGTLDVATTPDKAEYIHKNIKNSRLEYLVGAGHSSSIEEPDAVNNHMEAFLKSI